MEIVPDNKNYISKVLSCQILKRSDRHRETDLIAEVKVNTQHAQRGHKFQ